MRSTLLRGPPQSAIKELKTRETLELKRAEREAKDVTALEQNKGAKKTVVAQIGHQVGFA